MNKISRLLLLWTLAAVIFAVDLFSPIDGAVAVLYIAVILIAAQFGGQRMVWLTGLACGVLTIIAFVVGHIHQPFNSAYIRFGVSLVAIIATTILSLRDRQHRATLAEQAQILGLMHDTVIVRDEDNIITHWNEGAADVFGWHRDEALGKQCDLLLQCSYPVDEANRALRETDRWSGEIERTAKDGQKLVLAARLLRQRDTETGAVRIIETAYDLTEQHRADAERRASEQRYRSLFNCAGFAAWEGNWSKVRAHILSRYPDGEPMDQWLSDRPDMVHEAAGMATVSDINQAGCALFDIADPDLTAGINLIGRLASRQAENAFAVLFGQLLDGADIAETETQLVTMSGRTAEIVLHVTLLPEGEPWSRVLVTAFDVTERNQSRAKLEQASAELAHAARVSTLGQLTASIAHEVNQPLTAILTYGKSGKRWLLRETPDIDEVTQCLEQMVSNANRAAEVISRIRGLAKKSSPEAEPVDLEQLATESMALVRREAESALVTVRYERRDTCDCPVALGDRVQIQQVIVNLLLNAIQAMREVDDRDRLLVLSLDHEPDELIAVSVRDNGTGIAADPAGIFHPFFTTKADGMGMGLSICRTIIENQGGTIQAENNSDYGATFRFTLPAGKRVEA